MHFDSMIERTRRAASCEHVGYAPDGGRRTSPARSSAALARAAAPAARRCDVQFSADDGELRDRRVERTAADLARSRAV